MRQVKLPLKYGNLYIYLIYKEGQILLHCLENILEVLNTIQVYNNDMGQVKLPFKSSVHICALKNFLANTERFQVILRWNNNIKEWKI
jgi:hypothetical protein